MTSPLQSESEDVLNSRVGTVKVALINESYSHSHKTLSPAYNQTQIRNLATTFLRHNNN